MKRSLALALATFLGLGLLSCVYRKPHPVERESELRKLIG
jgi:hypothetical protein